MRNLAAVQLYKEKTIPELLWRWVFILLRSTAGRKGRRKEGRKEGREGGREAEEQRSFFCFSVR